jgi:hypothetical protein
MTMTTFEIIVIVLLAAIVVLLIVLLRIDIEGFRGVWQNQNAGVEQLSNIEVNTHHASSVLRDSVAPDVETLSNNFQYLLDGKKGVPALFDIVDKMHRNLCVEIADKMVDRVCPPTYVTPCNPPDNIRKWDCVNCPNISTCDALSTPTRTVKVVGKRCELTDEELMKRINEDKKED